MTYFYDLNIRLCRTLGFPYDHKVLHYISSYNTLDIKTALSDCKTAFKKKQYHISFFLKNRQVFLEELKRNKHKGKYSVDIMEQKLQKISFYFLYKSS